MNIGMIAVIKKIQKINLFLFAMTVKLVLNTLIFQGKLSKHEPLIVCYFGYISWLNYHNNGDSSYYMTGSFSNQRSSVSQAIFGRPKIDSLKAQLPNYRLNLRFNILVSIGWRIRSRQLACYFACFRSERR